MAWQGVTKAGAEYLLLPDSILHKQHIPAVYRITGKNVMGSLPNVIGLSNRNGDGLAVVYYALPIGGHQVMEQFNYVGSFQSVLS